MPISFSCRKCGKKLKAPDNAAGKTSKCPGCGSPVTCPEPVYEAEPVAPAKPDVPDILPDDPYDMGDGTPYGLDEEAAPLPKADPRRPCPMCGEMILANAAKCRFCGEVFDETLKKAAVKKKKKKKRSSEEDANLSAGDWIAAILCADIGCIASIIWMIQGKPKGLKMLGVSLLSIAIRIPIILAMQGNRQGVPGGP